MILLITLLRHAAKPALPRQRSHRPERLTGCKICSKRWPGCANSPTPRLLSIHILLENILQENEPAESDQVLEHLDTAVPEVPAPAPEKIRMIGQYDRTISLATCC